MTDDRLALLQSYLDRGWRIVPVPPRSKGPTITDWPNRTFGLHDFRPDSNVGIPLDTLLDTDLDARQAVLLADRFLPPTGLISGRASKPRAHRWYTSLNPMKTERYKDTNGETLVEYRHGAGLQTIVPPSVHESGEPIIWEAFGEPAEVDGREHFQQVARLASCALLARHWRPGSRHDTALAMGGALLNHGWPVEMAADFVHAAAWAAGDDDPEKSERAVWDTAGARNRGEATTGLPRLAELIGQPVVERLVRWLDLSSSSAPLLDLSSGPKPFHDPSLSWRQKLNEDEIPVGKLPEHLAALVTHIQPYTPMYPIDWAITMALPFWAAQWPGVRMQNLNLAIWSLGVSRQGAGKNVATDDLEKIAVGVAEATQQELTRFTAGTPQGMWHRMAGLNQRLLCYHDEYAGFLQQLKLDHMQSMKEALCSIYDGRSTFYQLSKEAIEVVDPYVVVAATVNKADIALHASRADLSNGYLSRFLVCAPDYDNREIEDYPDKIDQRRNSVIGRLTYHLSQHQDVTTVEWQESGRRDPERLNEYRRYLGVGTGERIDLDQDEEEPSIPPGRLLARVKKIAALMALAEDKPTRDADRPDVVLIRPTHLELAIEIVEQSHAYTERMIGWIGESAEMQLATKIYRLLVKHKDQGRSVRDLCMSTKAKSQEVKVCLDLLVSDGMVQQIAGHWFPVAA